MWTPKRIVLLLVGFALFLTAFIVYGQFFGGLDGLPALPQGYLDKNVIICDPPPTHPVNDLDQRLEMAFGPDCPELTAAIKFQIKLKGMVLAAGEFKIEDDGRVRLAPLSVAMFGKPERDGIPINTVRSHVAYLTFDQPITNPTDLNKHRIVGGELIGAVTITNNRKTPQIDDDLTVFTHGPVLYKDDEHRVWTNATISLDDMQGKPKPTQVTAVGMDLFLIPEDPKAKPAKPASKKDRDKSDGLPKQPAIAGVEKIILRQDVEMRLYTDSGMLGPNADKKDKAKPTDKAEKPKSLVIITTQGPFRYDAVKHHAQFDISDRPGDFPNSVAVKKVQEEGPDKGMIDELDCERLELQFQPRPEANVDPAKARKTNKDSDLEIETARAIVLPNSKNRVVLKSDADDLVAECDDFFYNARTKTTILKSPGEMLAIKDGNEIRCRELSLVEGKDNPQATAIGPGRIAILDAQTGKFTRHASWHDKLLFQNDGLADLLVLTREAVFRDDAQDQLLKADIIKVWMQPAPTAKAEMGAETMEAKDKPATNNLDVSGGRKPQKLEAIGHVQAKAPQLRVQQSDRLVIWFKDVAPDDPLLPKPEPGLPGALNRPAAAAPAPAPPMPGQPAIIAAAPTPMPTSAKPMTPPTVQPQAPAKPAEPKTTQPLDLRARSIEVHVLRAGSRTELHRLFTEGKVRVKQAPETPDDKGIDIIGETLQLTRHPEGNLLVVTCEHDVAQLRMNKLYIVGPVIYIDQAKNQAWVNGSGMMEMESGTSFQGDKLDKATPMTVFWKEKMYFDGQNADFRGGVQAEQDNAVLLCQTMQVFLDKQVSLKEGDRTNGQPPAKVRRLSCDQQVKIEDRTIVNGKLVKYQRIECPELSVDNEVGVVNAAGPGVVYILQPGSPETSLTARPTVAVQQVAHKPTAKDAKEDEMKLTRINYNGRMYANSKNHTAIFNQDVEVVNLPSEDPNISIDIDKLPPGGFHLSCEKLEVYSRQTENKATTNELLGRGRVTFRAQDYYGTSETVTFHSVKDQVILQGGSGGLARLYQIKNRINQNELKAKKILYIRKTGQIEISDGGGFSGSN